MWDFIGKTRRKRPPDIGVSEAKCYRKSGFWSGRADSNCRPPGPKPGALPLGHAPTELPQATDRATQEMTTNQFKENQTLSPDGRGLTLRRFIPIYDKS